MAVQHVNITDPDIHEPKGASTATANQVYVSNGAGSGTWRHWPTGWAQYQDDGAAQSLSTTFAALRIDGEGSLSNATYLPQEIRGSGNLWDTSTNKISPMYIGDAYSIRLRFTITAKSAAARLFWKIDIGNGSPFVVADGSFSLAKTPPFMETITTEIFTLNTFLDNGGEILVATDAGTCSVTAPDIFITRTHDGRF